MLMILLLILLLFFLSFVLALLISSPSALANIASNSLARLSHKLLIYNNDNYCHDSGGRYRNSSTLTVSSVLSWVTLSSVEVNCDDDNIVVDANVVKVIDELLNGDNGGGGGGTSCCKQVNDGDGSEDAAQSTIISIGSFGI